MAYHPLVTRGTCLPHDHSTLFTPSPSPSRGRQRSDRASLCRGHPGPPSAHLEPRQRRGHRVSRGPSRCRPCSRRAAQICPPHLTRRDWGDTLVGPRYTQPPTGGRSPHISPPPCPSQDFAHLPRLRTPSHPFAPLRTPSRMPSHAFARLCMPSHAFHAFACHLMRLRVPPHALASLTLVPSYRPSPPPTCQVENAHLQVRSRRRSNSKPAHSHRAYTHTPKPCPC